MHATEPLRWIPYVLLAAAAALVPTNSQAQWKTHWEYEGPTGADHWSDLDPVYATCNVGKEQSPINIQSAETGTRCRPSIEVLDRPYGGAPTEARIKSTLFSGSARFAVSART
jgi:carbonic anhydrase